MSLKQLILTLGVIFGLVLPVIALEDSPTSNKNGSVPVYKYPSIKDLAGRLLLDSYVEATKGIQTNRYIEFVGISTPTATLSSNHAQLWLNNGSKQLCTRFDDGSSACLAAGGGIGTITSVTAGLGLTGGGASGGVTLSLSTPIANSYIDGSSITKRGDNVIFLQSTLQSGATFFVSSGTASNLNTTTLKFADGTSQTTASSAGSFINNTSTLQSGATFYVSSGTVTSLIVHPSGPYNQNDVSLRIGSDMPYCAGLSNLGHSLLTCRRITTTVDTDGIVNADYYEQPGAGNQWAAFTARSTIHNPTNGVRAIGFQSGMVNDSTTTLIHYHDFYAGNYTTGTGNVAARYGYYFRTNAGTGTVTDQYAIYIETMTSSGNDYPIYIADSTNASSLGVFTASSATITRIITTTITPTNVVGQANANLAPAGNVGEVMVSSTPFATPAGMTSTSNIAVGTVTVTAGCWQLTGTFYAKATNASTSFTLMTSWIGVTALTAPSSVCVANQCSNGEIYMIDARPATVPGLNLGLTLDPSPVTVCVNSPTTYYVGGAVTFSVSTAGAVGGIRAVRFR